MVPHAIGAHGGPVEMLTMLDHDGERAHLPARGVVKENDRRRARPGTSARSSG
jgi:hypothetical protein